MQKTIAFKSMGDVISSKEFLSPCIILKEVNILFKPRLASMHNKISRVTTKRMDISYKFQTCKEEKKKKKTLST